ncbi:hypothetical protein [Synechococcus sp. KORDI-52]|uniref:hypothetical protein n=1 Tax=Synechococcus sp. KORDI-52 TaxID=585425 RepID=UPI000AF7E2F2|nr:hypothetical protein [Synechococcus sp. KORDI-52]
MPGLSHLSRSARIAAFMPQGRRFADLAGQNGEIDLSDQIDEVVREIQNGD